MAGKKSQKKKAASEDPNSRIVCRNRKARHEYEILDDYFSTKPTEIKPSEWRRLAKIGRRIFNRRIEDDMGCGGCVREIIGKLKKVWETYEEK